MSSASRSLGGVRTLGQVLVLVASLPPALAHELTHAVAALPWSESVAVVLDADGGAECRIDWHDDVPAWGVVLAYQAPTFVGAIVGLVGLVQLVSAGPPTAMTDQLVASAIAAWWVIYVVPSAADRDTSDAPQTNG